MELNLEIGGGPFDGRNVRKWPCVVNGLKPYEIDLSTTGCEIKLVDPVSFLSDQPIWGAYRAESAGEMIGGALSLAAGGDGKPTLSPIMPNLPSVRIAESYRNELKRLPHAMAVGQTLNGWLTEFLGMLGLRSEMYGLLSGELEMHLLDSRPKRPPMKMAVISDEEGQTLDQIPAEKRSHGPIHIRGHSGRPGVRLRAGLIDDPSSGGARPIVAPGPIGTVLTAPGLDMEEGSKRIYQSARGTKTEMLRLAARSRQPGIRPGEMVVLNRKVHGFDNWQVPSVTHILKNTVYDNYVTLILGTDSWHPKLPLARAPVLVSGIVDGGIDYDFHQPVPRDRMGRIKVTFPFVPTPTGEERDELRAADTDKNRRITMADFSEAQIQSFSTDPEKWEEAENRYGKGEFNDPFPGLTDDELNPEQKKERTELSEKRNEAVTYIAYKKTRTLDEADKDRDGVSSSRDDMISTELSEKLRDEKEHERIRAQWEKQQEWAANPNDEDNIPDFHADAEQKALVEEYGVLYGETEEENLAPEAMAAKMDAKDAPDRWPPRLSLPVINPMAGALHGFIAAHRHGDICRVAVHDPFNAEIMGFQYRDDRRINPDLSDAVAGIVVEHNYAGAWSGLMFRRTETMEENKSDTNESASASNTDNETAEQG